MSTHNMFSWRNKKKYQYFWVDLFKPFYQIVFTFIDHKSRKTQDATPISNVQRIRLLDPDCCYKFTYLGKQCRSRLVGFLEAN